MEWLNGGMRVTKPAINQMITQRLALAIHELYGAEILSGLGCVHFPLVRAVPEGGWRRQETRSDVAIEKSQHFRERCRDHFRFRFRGAKGWDRDVAVDQILPRRHAQSYAPRCVAPVRPADLQPVSRHRHMPHGVPSRFMALQRFRFVRPFVNAAFAWRLAMLDYRLLWGVGWGMYAPQRLRRPHYHAA